MQTQAEIQTRAQDIAEHKRMHMLERARAKRRALVRRARKDVCAFIEYAIPHEEDGSIVKNAPHHIEWQSICDAHRRVVIVAPVEHAKTSQLAIGRVLWWIGNHHNARLALISNTSAQAEKLLGAIKKHIESNPRVREVFPSLGRSRVPADPWHQTMITVDRSTISKEPTIQALGVGGPLVGSRLDGAVLDDVLDFENTYTIDQMRKTCEWFDSTFTTRLTADAWAILIGTPWDEQDLLHVVGARPGWHMRVYSAVENPDDPPTTWRPIWFSRDRLLDIQANNTPHNFARKYLCRVRVDATSRFQKSWIDMCLARGRGRTLLSTAPITLSGRRLACFTGVDLGVGQGEEHDLSVLFTLAVDERGSRIVVDIQSGRWQAPEIVTRIAEVQRRFASIVTVESNGAQRFLLQFAGAQGLTVRSFQTTAKNKYDEAFGVETLAIEMRAGQWIIPSGPSGGEIDDEVRAWIREMLYYKPEAHTGDRLMASWIARESARDAALPIQRRLDTISR